MASKPSPGPGPGAPGPEGSAQAAQQQQQQQQQLANNADAANAAAAAQQQQQQQQTQQQQQGTPGAPQPEDLIPTKFVWTYGGRQVHVCGSFSAWTEAVPLTWEAHPEHAAQGCFAVVIPLVPGYHQFKYIVDNEWRHDPARPHLPDPNGHLNNWVFLKRPDNTAAAYTQQHMVPPPGMQHAAAAAAAAAAQGGGMDWQSDPQAAAAQGKARRSSKQQALHPRHRAFCPPTQGGSFFCTTPRCPVSCLRWCARSDHTPRRYRSWAIP